MTNGTNNAARTMTRGWRIYYVWARRWPSPDRRYCGEVWAGTTLEAGEAARREFGLEFVYDIQDGRNHGIIRKGA